MAKDHMIILYVKDQEKSREFYQRLLEQAPVLDVPGMTEFIIAAGLRLGLMPERNIEKIICPALPQPVSGTGIPRCELYLVVDDPDRKYRLALSAGATAVSAAKARDWGDRVAYCADPDGHVIAFAC